MDVQQHSTDYYGPIEAIAGLLRDSYTYKGWRFHCIKGPMFSEAQKERITTTESGGKLNLPEAYFGHNLLYIEYIENGLKIAFNAFESVKGCADASHLSEFVAPINEFTPEISKVATTADDLDMKLDTSATRISGATLPKASPADWSISSRYWGTIWRSTISHTAAAANSSNIDSSVNPGCCNEYAIGCDKHDRKYSDISLLNDELLSYDPMKGDEVICDEVTDESLPIDLLAGTSLPILWFQQVDLFNDDLADKGFSASDVKLRVMDEFFYVLLRHNLRVDGVIHRQIDTRLFYKFGDDYLLRDFQWKESPAMTPSLELPTNGQTANTLYNEEDVQYHFTTRIPL